MKAKIFLITVANIIFADFLAAQVTGAFTDTRDGKKYKTVKIEKQTWMAENLNYKTADSWCYNDSAAYCKTYGRLYTWAAAKKACPVGWHLPGDNEWKALEIKLGISKSGADSVGWRGTNQGGQLKESIIKYWKSPNTGASNITGFSALPGGYRYTSGKFYLTGKYGYWWSASEYDQYDAWIRYLTFDHSQIRRAYLGKDDAFSVRCIKN